MAVNDLPALTWSFVDMINRAAGGWVINSTAGDFTVASRWSIYKLGYNRPIRVTGVRFYFADTIPAGAVKVAIWREAVAAALVSKTAAVAANGVQTILFDVPYTFVDADYYRVLKSSVFNAEEPVYTRAVHNPSIYQGQPSYPFLASPNVIWYAGVGVKSAGDANPTVVDAADDRFPIEPILEYV